MSDPFEARAQALHRRAKALLDVLVLQEMHPERDIVCVLAMALASFCALRSGEDREREATALVLRLARGYREDYAARREELRRQGVEVGELP